MFAAIVPSSPAALAVLALCFVLMLAFEFSNGFDDAANDVETVIYTNSLKPLPASCRGRLNARRTNPIAVSAGRKSGSALKRNRIRRDRNESVAHGDQPVWLDTARVS